MPDSVYQSEEYARQLMGRPPAPASAQETRNQLLTRLSSMVGQRQDSKGRMRSSRADLEQLQQHPGWGTFVQEAESAGLDPAELVHARNQNIGDFEAGGSARRFGQWMDRTGLDDVVTYGTIAAAGAGAAGGLMGGAGAGTGGAGAGGAGGAGAGTLAPVSLPNIAAAAPSTVAAGGATTGAAATAALPASVTSGTMASLPAGMGASAAPAGAGGGGSAGSGGESGGFMDRLGDQLQSGGGFGLGGGQPVQASRPHRMPYQSPQTGPMVASNMAPAYTTRRLGGNRQQLMADMLRM